MIYKQCLLRKENKIDTAWIPEQYATVNKALRIKDDDGWIVKVVYTTGIDYDKLVVLSRDYLRTRKYSDM